ncbi:MAG: 1-acyl-sn-glycerol-3-phosphate acyltransferase [Sandaracinaceae bacterium]|nr:1-acyl-sn-glycerol-3-phosphate acyltransferase [Sandaracinaceae bacterium]
MRDLIVKLVHLLLRLFFRRVEITGLEHVPEHGGGILVSWHPNGMIDPALIFETFPRDVVFGARHGLFKIPVLGAILRATDTVPIYRAQDMKGTSEKARDEANQKSLDALSDAIVEGKFSALFPEGVSHDAPHLMELKTGVARFYYRARQRKAPDDPEPVVIPVGLHYDEKRIFRSNVLVAFHAPIELPGELAITPPEDEEREARRERYRAFTDEVERVLRETVHCTETWEVHHLMHRARKLLRAERAAQAGSHLEAPTMEERTRAFARIWAGYYARLETHPEEVEALKARIAEYDADMRALEIQDHELDQPPNIVNVWLGILLGLQAILVYLFFPPIMLVGSIVNLPPAGLLWLLTKWASKTEKDEASIKVLAGAVLFPLFWLAAAILAGWGHSVLHEMYPSIPDTFITAGVVTFLLALAGGAISLRYLRLARETARAIRVRLTRERRRLTIARLRVDRSELFEALTAIGAGLDLPGQVMPDGTIGPTIVPPEPV